MQKYDPKQFVRSGIVKIIVGPEREEFNVHKSLICQESVFFERCLNNSNYKEAQNNEVELLDDEVDPFILIVIWLYSVLAGPTDTKYPDYLKAYVLADRLMMPACKDDIVDAIRKYHKNTRCGPRSIGDMPATLICQDLPLRRYLVDQYAYDLTQRDPLWTAGDETSDQASIDGVSASDTQVFASGGLLAVDIVRQLLSNYRKKSSNTAIPAPHSVPLDTYREPVKKSQNDEQAKDGATQ